MSSYNGEKYIEQQIRSIMGQESEYRIDLRIRDDALGDQDDVWLPRKVQTACEHLAEEEQAEPLLFACTSYLVHDNLVPVGTTREKRRGLSIYSTIIQNICPGHSQVFNKALLALPSEDFQLERIYVYDSWILNIAVLRGRVLFSNEPWTYYRQHPGNVLGAGKGLFRQFLLSYHRIHAGDGGRHRAQYMYFMERYEERILGTPFYAELCRFLTSKSLMQRLRYIVQSKLHRQSRIETFPFRLAYLIGLF